MPRAGFLGVQGTSALHTTLAHGKPGCVFSVHNVGNIAFWTLFVPPRVLYITLKMPLISVSYYPGGSLEEGDPGRGADGQQGTWPRTGQLGGPASRAAYLYARLHFPWC
eukprot:1187176-Prorocentrum_minimum.AAC.1